MFGLSALEARLVEYGVLALALLAGYGWWSHTLKAEGAAACKAEQLQTDQDEEKRRRGAQKEVDDESQRAAARARADADRLARAAGVLRPQVAALVQRCDSAPAVVGSAASSAGDLLAYVQGRVELAARGTVDYADDLARSGRECAGKYDALTR